MTDLWQDVDLKLAALMGEFVQQEHQWSWVDDEWRDSRADDLFREFPEAEYVCIACKKYWKRSGPSMFEEPCVDPKYVIGGGQALPNYHGDPYWSHQIKKSMAEAGILFHIGWQADRVEVAADVNGMTYGIREDSEMAAIAKLALATHREGLWPTAPICKCGVAVLEQHMTEPGETMHFHCRRKFEREGE